VLRPFLTAAFSCNKHRQRPADRCRGVPRHLSAPPRRTASPRCASGCVSGRRVGLVQHPRGGRLSTASCRGRSAAYSVLARPRSGGCRRSAAGAVSLEASCRASWRGSGRSAASSSPGRRGMSAAGPAAALALKTLSRVSAGDNDLAGNAAAGQALWAQQAAAAAVAAAAPAAAAAGPAQPAPKHVFACGADGQAAAAEHRAVRGDDALGVNREKPGNTHRVLNTPRLLNSPTQLTLCDSSSHRATPPTPACLTLQAVRTQAIPTTA